MFARSKKAGLSAAKVMGFGLVMAFILTWVASAMQENGIAQYNVMGVTMPPWFYGLLVINSIVFLVGSYKVIIAFLAIMGETGAFKPKGRAMQRINNLEEITHPADAFVADKNSPRSIAR